MKQCPPFSTVAVLGAGLARMMASSTLTNPKSRALRAIIPHEKASRCSHAGGRREAEPGEGGEGLWYFLHVCPLQQVHSAALLPSKPRASCVSLSLHLHLAPEALSAVGYKAVLEERRFHVCF